MIFIILTLDDPRTSGSYASMISFRYYICQNGGVTRVDVEVFRNILDICPRVEGKEFTEIQNDDDALTFLIDLGYKDPLISYHQQFVRIGEDYQEYVLGIPDVMLNDAIKQSKSYQMFIKYSTSQIPPKKSRAEKEEATKQVHATHARIVTESVPESAKKNTDNRSSRSVVIQDTPSAPNLKPSTLKPKLKGTRGSSEGTGTVPGVPDESIVFSATSDEGTATKPGVPNKENVITKEKVILELGSEQESEYSEEGQLDNEEKDDKEGDADDEGDDHINEDEEMTNAEVKESGNGDEEDTDATKADAEKIEQAKDDSKKVELPPTSSSLSISLGFGDQFLKLYSDTSLICTVKDTTNEEISSLLDIKIQSEVPYIQSPSVLKVHVSIISEPFVLTVQETPSTAPVTALPLPSISTIPHVPQQTTLIPTPPIITKTPTITTDVLKSDTLTVVQLRVAKLEKDSKFPMVVDDYLGSKLGDALQKALQKHSEDLIQKYFVKPAPESSEIQTPTINLEQESEKSALEILKIKKEQAEKQKMPKYTIKSTDKAALKEYDKKTLIEDENAMDKGVADTVKDNKRKHDDDDDDEDPPTGPNQGKKTKRRRTKESKSSKKPSSTKETLKGKALLKGSKTSKSASAKETVKEPIAEVVMDDAGEDVVCDDNQPQDTSKPKIAKTPNP
ncbi:hypothetical protein Tco_1354207 [Tanacetum coccineum]